MALKIGDRVQLPEGGEALVLALDDDTVLVQLDGEATGRYPADRVTPIAPPVAPPRTVTREED